MTLQGYIESLYAQERVFDVVSDEYVDAMVDYLHGTITRAELLRVEPNATM